MKGFTLFSIDQQHGLKWKKISHGDTQKVLSFGSIMVSIERTKYGQVASLKKNPKCSSDELTIKGEQDKVINADFALF